MPCGKTVVVAPDAPAGGPGFCAASRRSSARAVTKSHRERVSAIDQNVKREVGTIWRGCEGADQ